MLQCKSAAYHFEPLVQCSAGEFDSNGWHNYIISTMETYHYPQFNAVVYAAKFKEVNNADVVRTRIVKAATTLGTEGEAEREAVKFAFIEAKLVSRVSLSPPSELRSTLRYSR